MPTYIPTSDDAPFMFWVPGTTESKERAERIAQSIAQNCSIDEVDRQEEPFTYQD